MLYTLINYKKISNLFTLFLFNILIFIYITGHQTECVILESGYLRQILEWQSKEKSEN